MDGPDLSHLLDTDDSPRPSAAVLDGIVRRHRRLRARRARTAATIGVVLALTAGGVGIGLSHHPTTSSAGPATNTHRGTSNPSQAPPSSVDGRQSTAAGSPPAGLGWIDTGTGEFSAAAAAPYGTGSGGSTDSGRLQVTGSLPTATSTHSVYCSDLDCSTNTPNDLALGGALVRHLFTRTSDGVTVRAFTAAWTVSPLELVPLGASAKASSGPSASGSGSGASAPSTTSASAPNNTSASAPGATPAPAPDTTSAPAPGTTSSTTPSCALFRSLVVEVSDAGAVGVVTVPLGTSLNEPINVLADQVVGVAEQAPIAVVVAHVRGSVAAVKATFSGGGQDSMTVVGGWAVLVHKLAGADLPSPNDGALGNPGAYSAVGRATVYALSGAGAVLEQAVLPGSGFLALPVEACQVSSGNHKVPGTSGSGSGSAGSTSAGSGSAGSVGSGSAGSGSVTGPAGSTSISAVTSSGAPSVGPNEG